MFSFSLSALRCSLFSKEHGSSTGLCSCFLIILKGETISLTSFSINHSKSYCAMLGSLHQNEGRWWICKLVEHFFQPQAWSCFRSSSDINTLNIFFQAFFEFLCIICFSWFYFPFKENGSWSRKNCLFFLVFMGGQNKWLC